jgi:DNA-binding CsgD family transcriptional regulator
MLLEREGELRAVGALLESAAAGRGGVLWIEGPPGIGKTLLVDAACQQARGIGLRVLTARASDLEREFAFAVIRSLFEPALAGFEQAQSEELLAGAARLALPVITLEGQPPEGAGVASLGTLHGLYWLTANLAETSPLLLAVDDGHWADTSSLRALAYLARRIADLPVALVLAARRPGPEVDVAAVDVLQHEPVATVLRPGPLSRASADTLISSVLGDAGDEPFRAACHEATEGNPLLLQALLSELAATGVAPHADAVRDRAPAIIAGSVLSRLRQLSAEAGAVARALAVLRGGAQLRHVAAVAGVDPLTAADAADSLARAHLLAEERPLRFAHPLVEEAIVERMGVAERHQAHRKAANLLATEGAAQELIAAHLMQTEALADPEVVRQLRGAARIALAKGAPEPATSYLRRALEEPPDPVVRPEVLHELGSATVRVSFTEGVAQLELAFAETTDPVKRANVALELARSLRTTLEYQRALSVLDEAIAPLGDGADALRLELEAEALGLARRDPQRREGAAERIRKLLTDSRLPARPGAVLVANSALDCLQEAGDADRAVRLARDALTLTLAEDAADPGALLPATMVLLATDHLDDATRACESAVAGARRRGSIFDFASASVLRAQASYLAGALAEAEADARLADELTEEHQVTAARRYTQAWLVLVLVERGQLAEADEGLANSDVGDGLAYLLDARGRLRLAQGRPAEALAEFQRCGQRLDRRGMRHPGLMPWRANAALALHQLGRIGEARQVVADAVRLAETFGASRALGIALRTRGLIDGSVDALRESVAVLERTPATLEHARALVDLGSALRRSNQRSAAREHLARGQEIAHRCGADALVQLARAELAATGARPRTIALSGAEALTPSERRVAELAAGGLSNRDVAQALFVSTKTVETHLGRVYRKLAVAGRADLAGALT